MSVKCSMTELAVPCIEGAAREGVGAAATVTAPARYIGCSTGGKFEVCLWKKKQMWCLQRRRAEQESKGSPLTSPPMMVPMENTRSRSHRRVWQGAKRIWGREIGPSRCNIPISSESGPLSTRLGPAARGYRMSRHAQSRDVARRLRGRGSRGGET